MKCENCKQIIEKCEDCGNPIYPKLYHTKSDLEDRIRKSLEHPTIVKDIRIEET